MREKAISNQQSNTSKNNRADNRIFDLRVIGSASVRPALVNILALQYRDSGKLSTDVPDVDTGIDWLVYLAQYSQQCQAQSHFVVRSRLDIVENTEIMAGPNQAFYCGTLRPDYRPFRTGIFN